MRKCTLSPFFWAQTFKTTCNKYLARKRVTLKLQFSNEYWSFIWSTFSMADIKTQTDTVFLEPGTVSHHFLLHLPPPYPSPYISPQHCPSPPPAYTLLHHSCSCGGRREHKRRRLVTVLSLMIMILLSITMGVAWKHWELVTEVKGGRWNCWQKLW